jgi:hypothetical protein
MAKVTGPAHSDDASGSFGGGMVFAKVRGVNYVRALVIPRNSMTESQGNYRMILGGLGKAIKPVAGDSNVVVALNTITAGKNTWGSNFIKSVARSSMYDATSFEAVVTAFNAHSAKTDFTAAAVALGMTDMDVAYKGTANKFTAGIQLYVLAKYLVGIQGENPDLLASVPFDTAIGSWTTTQINALVDEIAPAV